MYLCCRLWSRSVQYIMEQLINVKYISYCGDNNLYTVYISRFYENLNYRRKYDPLFHFYYIFYIPSSWVLILYKSIENWCYKQIKVTPWRCVHVDFVPNFQCSWRDFERTGAIPISWTCFVSGLLSFEHPSVLFVCLTCVCPVIALVLPEVSSPYTLDYPHRFGDSFRSNRPSKVGP